MIPAGYMAKRVVARPDWLRAERVSRASIQSVGVSPRILPTTSASGSTTAIGWSTRQRPSWRSRGKTKSTWPKRCCSSTTFMNCSSMPANGRASSPSRRFAPTCSVPEAKVFEGYDVVTFSAQTSPECSPLSCNALASGVEANTRCLLQSFEQARALLENGTFNNSEPGPYRVFAVYSVAWSGTV